MQSSIQINKDGKLTKAQKLYLLGQFLERLGFMLIWLIGVFFIESIYKNGSTLNFYVVIITIFKVAGVTALGGYVTIYALDMLWIKPIYTKGVLSKYKKRVGHSDQYWLAIKSHKILTTKMIWLSLQTKSSYELYYGRWTKQLLSYEQLPSEQVVI